jgi:hypothetical protein
VLRVARGAVSCRRTKAPEADSVDQEEAGRREEGFKPAHLAGLCAVERGGSMTSGMSSSACGGVVVLREGEEQRRGGRHCGDDDEEREFGMARRKLARFRRVTRRKGAGAF